MTVTAGVEFLLADLSLHPQAELERDLLPRLHDSEQVRYRKFAHPHRRRVWLAGRALLLAALSRHFTRIDAQALRTDEKGGVRYGDGALHLSLSHSRDLLAVALAHNPVGVDIEWPRPRGLLQHPEDVFCAAEVEYLQGLPQAEYLKTFYALWTLKEASCKAAGTPLVQTLRGTHFDFIGGRAALPAFFPDGEWCFMSAGIEPGWQIALALSDSGINPAIECWRMTGPHQWQPETLLAPRYLYGMKH